MKQSEKLEIILKDLYGHKDDGKYYSVKGILEANNIYKNSVESDRLAHKLEDNGSIDANFVLYDCLAKINTSGIEYYEEIQNEQLGENFTKQSEKLEIVLKDLYGHKDDGKYYSVKGILEGNNIYKNSVELERLAHKLKDDNYIDANFALNDCLAKINAYGIEYYENKGDIE